MEIWLVNQKQNILINIAVPIFILSDLAILIYFEFVLDQIADFSVE